MRCAIQPGWERKAHATMRTVTADSLAPSTRPVWGAFWWSLAFGLISLYWAAGGTVGVSTLAYSIQDAAREGHEVMRVSTAVTGLVKIAAGVLALLSLWPRGGMRARTVLLSLLWGVGVVYTVYGVLGLVEKGLMATGVLDVADGIGEAALVWYLALWEPLWVLGGVLFLLIARCFGRIPRTV